MDLSPFTFFVSETKLCIAKFFQFQKMVDEISVDSFDNVWKVVVVFFFLIWHAARTYGRRRGNIIVSNFWMSSCIWRGPRCAHFVTLGGQWGGGVKQVRSGPYTLHAVADPLDVLISRSQNGRIWIWIQIISLCCVINSTYLYLKIYFLLFLKGVS